MAFTACGAICCGLGPAIIKMAEMPMARIAFLLSLALILVIAPSFPSHSTTRGAVTMVNVHFFNLPNITIGDFQGVEGISFDTWRACYYGNGTGTNVPGTCVKATTVIGGYEPYSVTIYNRDNGQEVTSLAAWSIILVAQFFGFIMILIGAVVSVLYAWCYWNLMTSRCHFQYQYEQAGPGIPDMTQPRGPQRGRWKCGHYRRPITFWILFSAWLSMVIILTIDLGVYMSIKNTMFLLGSGGTQRIETTVGAGLVLNMVICGCLTFALLFKLFDKGYNQKSAAKPGNPMPSPWNCSLLLGQYYEDCYHMECYLWC